MGAVKNMERQFLHAYAPNSAQFQQFEPENYEPVNLARLELSVARVRALLNDPDLLAARVIALREGSAKWIDAP
jgi:hypothetical protein